MNELSKTHAARKRQDTNSKVNSPVIPNPMFLLLHHTVFLQDNLSSQA